MAGSPLCASDEVDDAEPEIRRQAMIASEAWPRIRASALLRRCSTSFQANINSVARMLTLDDLGEEPLRELGLTINAVELECLDERRAWAWLVMNGWLKSGEPFRQAMFGTRVTTACRVDAALAANSSITAVTE
jgi:hypothetical protein